MHPLCYLNLNSGIELELFKWYYQFHSEWHTTLVRTSTTLNLRSILACEGVAILGVLDK